MKAFIRIGTITLFALLVSSGGTQVCAKSFRIETKVYRGNDKEPMSETITLFQNGVVYDFLTEPAQIAVFRKPMPDQPGRFVLLDTKLQRRAELTTDRIGRALLKLQRWAARQQDPTLRFSADPHFEGTFTPETGELVLESYLQTYRLETTPADDLEALAEYRGFLDWYTRLNAFMVSHTPPQPRLHVNAALSKYKVFPLVVELSRAGIDTNLVAKHDFTWRLSQQDRARIDEAHDAMSSYRKVSNEEWLHHEDASGKTE